MKSDGQTNDERCGSTVALTRGSRGGEKRDASPLLRDNLVTSCSHKPIGGHCTGCRGGYHPLRVSGKHGVGNLGSRISKGGELELICGRSGNYLSFHRLTESHQILKTARSFQRCHGLTAGARARTWHKIHTQK